MHAYLIQAHGSWDLLEKALALYDDARNDLYLHIDANSRNVPFEQIKGACRRSRVEFVRRVPIVYASYSICIATFELLEAATRRRSYDYYHLVSGQDLPLATQDAIHEFFRGALKEVAGRRVPVNFVSLWGGPGAVNQSYWTRFYAHNPWIRHARARHRPLRALFFLNRCTRRLQYLLQAGRKALPYPYYFGDSWFSITDDLARHVVARRAWCERVFSRHVFCPDEALVQTLVMNSEFRSTLYSDVVDEGPSRSRRCLRLIDWSRMENRMSPRVWRREDLGILESSSCLFARKFDPKVDAAVIDRWIDHLGRAVDGVDAAS
ncbi:MAG: hypothetical protein JXP48_12160 [Acidobacteria bacterium]|nr:hypothetical protein [Acidobacteriota bacterium]